MIYKRIFLMLVKTFDLKSELKKIYRPEGVKNWGFSDYADIVYEVYVTKYKIGVKNASFGFWVHHEDEGTAYKLALNKAIKFLIWTYKVRLNKWLK